MNSVFLISTASQAFFLSLTPELVKGSVLILTVKREKDSREILKYLKKLNWSEIYTWFIPLNDTKLEYLKFLSIKFKIYQLKKAHQNFENIYFGSYLNQYHLSLLAEYEGKSNFFLLYDGLQIISIAHLRKDGNSHIQKHPPLMRLLGFKRPKIKSLGYVSPIKLDVFHNDTIQLIKGTGVKSEKEYDENLIFFIGQPLTNIGLLEEQFYINTLEKLNSHFKGKTMVYVSHPREGKHILEVISNFMLVTKNDTIFEEYYMYSKKFPYKVISFYSSVLLNLVYLKARSEIIAIKLPSSEIKIKSAKQKIEAVYTYFEGISEKNFRLLDIKEI